MADDHLNPLRDALIRCWEDYTADQAIRAMASALTTIIIGGTRDGAAAHDALEKPGLGHEGSHRGGRAAGGHDPAIKRASNSPAG